MPWPPVPLAYTSSRQTAKQDAMALPMTAVTAVTDEPPTVMLCINRQSAIIPILQGNRDLCINTLNDSQQDIAEHFAGLTTSRPKNARIPYLA